MHDDSARVSQWAPGPRWLLRGGRDAGLDLRGSAFMHWLFSNPKSASQADTAKRATAQRGQGAGPTGCRPAADAAALGERRGWPASLLRGLGCALDDGGPQTNACKLSRVCRRICPSLQRMLPRLVAIPGTNNPGRSRLESGARVEARGRDSFRESGPWVAAAGLARRAWHRRWLKGRIDNHDKPAHAHFNAPFGSF
ncbi:hypothetical protein IQ07DRAFT_598695 [Pyrenochaeta sp. DS3sAY3a]|nr:hypothetical protein IQ07DRAFT_598695 [Pyrenochaeta sp. DS3sAY3a]